MPRNKDKYPEWTGVIISKEADLINCRLSPILNLYSNGKKPDMFLRDEVKETTL